MNRDNPETWSKKGSKTYGERVTQKALQILGTHQPELLPEEVGQKINEIARKTEKELESMQFAA